MEYVDDELDPERPMSEEEVQEASRDTADVALQIVLSMVDEAGQLMQNDLIRSSIRPLIDNDDIVRALDIEALRRVNTQLTRVAVILAHTGAIAARAIRYAEERDLPIRADLGLAVDLPDDLGPQ